MSRGKPALFLCLALLLFLPVLFQVSQELSAQSMSRERLLSYPMHQTTGRGETGPEGMTGYIPYHSTGTLNCTDCHVMHASMEHNHQGGSGNEGGIPGFPWETTPNPKLLMAPNPLDLCLMCHDNVAGVPDVMATDINGLNERSAGFFGQPEEDNPNGHNLGRSLPDDQGLCLRCHFIHGDPGEMQVTCIDCHNPHGNWNPRNLQWPWDPEGSPGFGLLVDPSATGLDKYESDHISYGTLNTAALLEVSSLCSDCHHSFSGESYIDPDHDNIHSRHPTYDSERSSPNHINQGEDRGSSNPDHWELGTGSGFLGTERVPFVVDGAASFSEGLVVDASTNGVFCLSCHKPHGSDEPFAITFTVGEVVDWVGCDQCHYIAQVDQ